MTPYQIDHLHRYAREYAEERKDCGAEFDKKLLRWNDIVAAGKHYSDCGVIPNMRVAEAGVREAVSACVIGDPQYVAGRGPLTIIQEWMVTL